MPRNDLIGDAPLLSPRLSATLGTRLAHFPCTFELPRPILRVASRATASAWCVPSAAATACASGPCSISAPTTPSRARSVGAERICLKALEELHFPDLLQRLGVGERDARIAVALVMAKMLQPSSEHKAHIWLHHTSTTLELLRLDGGQGPSLSKLYRTNDLLWKHREALQKGLFLRERQLLDLPATIVFYDLSNTFYTGHANATLRRFGRSKQKRSDCPLITLALVLDGAGFPRSCEILPGNASEPGSLEGALARLEAVRDGDGPQPTVVMDAGIASEANLAWLRQQGYDWICVSRAAKPDPPAGAAAATLATSAGHAVQAWQLASEDAGEAQLYAVSEGKQISGKQILDKHRQRFESALQALHDGLSKPRYLKAYDRVQQRVGRLRERHSKVSRHYRVKVTAGPDGKASAVTFERTPEYAEADAAAGAYVLRTSHTDWDLDRVLRTYWRLTEIEAPFRSLKSELGLRPIWHHKDERVSTHLFIAVLAYHGVHLIRTRLQARGIRLSWQSIRERLSTWVRITTTVRQVNGALIVNRQDVRPSAEVAEISRAAGVEPRIHRVRSRVPA